MTPAFVTAATCTHVFEAEIVRGALADAGVSAWLADAEIVTADWTLSVAVGGVKVRVAEADATDAAALLEAPAPAPGFEPPTPAEVAAWRAFVSALVAFGWPPFVLWAGYQIGRVITTADGETAQTWRRTAFALAAVLASLGIAAVFLGIF